MATEQERLVVMRLLDAFAEYEAAHEPTFGKIGEILDIQAAVKERREKAIQALFVAKTEARLAFAHGLQTAKNTVRIPTTYDNLIQCVRMQVPNWMRNPAHDDQAHLRSIADILSMTNESIWSKLVPSAFVWFNAAAIEVKDDKPITPPKGFRP